MPWTICYAEALMQIETVPIDAAIPDPENERLHPDRNIEAIKASLARFGQQTPIVVDAQGIIRKGNGTWTAATEACGPVDVPEMDEIEADQPEIVHPASGGPAGDAENVDDLTAPTPDLGHPDA